MEISRKSELKSSIKWKLKFSTSVQNMCFNELQLKSKIFACAVSVCQTHKNDKNPAHRLCESDSKLLNEPFDHA